MSQSPSPSILVLGSRGMLGRAMMRRLGGRAAGADLPECDISRLDQIEPLLASLAPKSILNCAAWTDVDGAESQPDAARRINSDAVGQLGRLAAAAGIHLITISTDYVFTGEGTAPWPEDPPDSAFGPRSVYGQTKLEGERALRAAGNWCIVRTQWLYGAGGKNFIDTIARLSAERETMQVVDDQIGAPTWVEDLAEALELLLDRRATGVYHCANSGFVSWHGVAERIVERLGRNCRVIPCSSDQFPRPAARPHNSRLSQDKYARLAGRPMRPWTEALDAYLASQP